MLPLAREALAQVLTQVAAAVPLMVVRLVQSAVLVESLREEEVLV